MIAEDKDILTFAKAANIFRKSVKIVDGLLFVPEHGVELCGDHTISDDVFMAGIVKEGSVGITIRGVKHQLTAGDIMLFFPGDTIDGRIEVENLKGALFISSTNRAIDLVKDNSLYLYSLRLRSEQVLRLPEDNFDNINCYVSKIQSKAAAQTITHLLSQTLLSLTKVCICELFEGIQNLGYEQETEGVSRIEKLYKEFITLLSTTPIRPREVEWYARQLNITPKYLSKICRESSGRSASEWIREYAKIDITCHLRNSALSIKEVANRLGYSSLAFFGKTVKRWFGVTPTELRENLRDYNSKKIIQ
ncbi:MAG: helix-turn-helix domain-containing protein [Muribaculaceae bacterium]|nr:helix-turn-helix domain-containing protein [Muribaculaceae bacterium]